MADLLGSRGRSLLGFYWDGFGPCSSVAGLTLLELQRSSYLCHWDEIESYRAVAKLDGWRKRHVLRDAVRELLRENGHPHGISVFGSLPTETTNYAVRLIPTATVKQAYFDWLQADPWGNGDTWSSSPRTITAGSWSPTCSPARSTTSPPCQCLTTAMRSVPGCDNKRTRAPRYPTTHANSSSTTGSRPPTNKGCCE